MIFTNATKVTQTQATSLKCHKEISLLKHTNIDPFNLLILCVTKGFTDHSGKGRGPQGATTDLHVISLSSCELRTNRLAGCHTLPNGVTAFLAVFSTF